LTDAADRLAGFRHRRDHFFAHHPHSPLSAEQRGRFTGLDYFPARADLALALPLDESGEGIGDEIELPTSDDKRKAFVRVGRIRFPVDDDQATLTVFQDAERGDLFIPFRDATTGTETYELGRYLEPQQRPDGTLHVDFNYAYNPFCAYGEGWSCPIPPEENRLTIPLRAGERTFREIAEEPVAG
jgi:uncharacterized protein (DUF1684 family)